jgi:hypothetical protein
LSPIRASPPTPRQRRQVRLARPDGRLLATIELPLADSSAGTTDYAIIHDYAVYAILSVHSRATEDGAPAVPYFTLEVEGERWMALPEAQLEGCYALYDEVPRGLSSVRARRPRFAAGHRPLSALELATTPTLSASTRSGCSSRSSLSWPSPTSSTATSLPER